MPARLALAVPAALLVLAVPAALLVLAAAAMTLPAASAHGSGTTHITVVAHDYHFTTNRTGETTNPDIPLEPGSTVEVTLQNVGEVTHNLHVLGPVEETSPDVAGGESVTFTFSVPEDAPSSFAYRCDYHQGPMNGDIVPASQDGSGGGDGAADGTGNGAPGPGLAAALAAVGVAAAVSGRRR